MRRVTSGIIIGPAEEKSGEEVVAHVRASLPFHPDRHALNENAKAMSLQVSATRAIAVYSSEMIANVHSKCI